MYLWLPSEGGRRRDLAYQRRGRHLARRHAINRVVYEYRGDFFAPGRRMHDFRRAYGRQVAGGSMSTPTNYDKHRKMGAIARTMLVEAAANEWGVPVSECEAVAGEVVHKPTGKKLSYGTLATAASKLPVPDENSVSLKKVADFKLLGKRIGGVDNPRIVTGQPLFGIDQKQPGLKYASYVRCPVFTGKVKETVTRRGTDNRPVYDDVVLDAPPTGRVVTFLGVTEAMSGLAKRGPIHSQAPRYGSLSCGRSGLTCTHASSTPPSSGGAQRSSQPPFHRARGNHPRHRHGR